MAFSLYSATVPGFLQILGSVEKLLNKAEDFCREMDLEPSEIIRARLAPDMLPFAYQVKSTSEHSIGAIESARIGFSSPSLESPPDSFAGLHQKVSSAIEALKAIAPADIDMLLDRDVRWEFKATRYDFTAQHFLISYAQPNFYFHATTAYDILRNKGLSIGKMDFMGRLLLKT